MKFKLTHAERHDRVERRRTLRATTAEKVEALRDWRQARAEVAKKRAADAAAARRSRPRGVDRVPARLHGLTVTPEPHLVGKRCTRLAQPEDLAPAGNYETRRARGQRGHQRPPRRRFMPGAEARRLERNRKAAQDLWA